MSDDRSTPPGPGWWLASDGRWYPPESAPQAQQPPPQQPPWQPPPQAAKKSGKGCLVALGIVGVVMLLIAGLFFFVVWKVFDTVEDVADGITVGDVECPTADDVSDIIGYDVELAASGSVIVASGCNYTSSGDTAGVSIVSGSGLIAEEVISDLESEAQGNGTEASSIDAGDGGRAYGSAMRSAAATQDDGKVVEVEIFSEGTEPVGDEKDEAVEILEQFLDLND
jgi:hypothetical protein